MSQSQHASFQWEHKENYANISSVPKTRCPPAKPPRRKLSYPNENTKISNIEVLVQKADKPLALSNDLRTKLLNAGITVNGTTYTEALSKSSSSASSKGTSGTEGSDYGSLQGDHHQVHPLRMTKSMSTGGDFYLSSTPKHAENRKNNEQENSLWSMSPNSVYYTPNSTQNWNKKHKPLNMADKLLASHKSGSFYRRHNSDPQIGLDRRPSRRGIRQRAQNDRKSHSFLGVVGGYPHFNGPNNNNPERIELSTDYRLLSEEAKMLREMCDKLWEQLKQTQLKLETVQNSKTIKPQSTSMPLFSDLLSEVYYAQSERDKAVKERLQLAASERKHLLEQIETLKNIIFRKNICEGDSDDEFNEPGITGLDKVLEGLETCNSPSKLEEHRERLLNKMSQFQNVRQNRLSQQLSKVIAQRDAAIAKAQSLTDDMEQMRWASKANVGRKGSDPGPDSGTKTLKRMEELEEELASLRLCYSLQANHPNGPMSLDHHEDICFYALDDRETNGDANALKMMLKREYEARLGAEEECKKMSRLVNVLRKKLVGSSVGIPV